MSRQKCFDCGKYSSSALNVCPTCYPIVKPSDNVSPLPCPFCGGPSLIQQWHGGGPSKRMICCDTDDCKVRPQVTGSTRSRAIAAWNARPREARLASLLNRAKLYLDITKSSDYAASPLCVEINAALAPEKP